MELLQFHKMRTAVQVNAAPARGMDVRTFEGNIRNLLMSSGMFESVEVEATDDPDQLVIAMCEARPQFDEATLAANLERIWNSRGRYAFWEAHAMVVDENGVEFEAATRLSDTGHYVTVHLIAQRPTVPAQRSASD
jgi:hypothetical protein